MNMLLLSYSDFPLGDASAVRQEAFLNVFKKIGYNPLIVCMNKKSEFMKINEYKENKYISLRYSNFKKINKVKNYFFYKKNLKKIINDFKQQIDLIFVEDIPLPAWFYLKKYCKKNKVTLIHDSVEWYSAAEFRLRYLSYLFISKNIVNRLIIDKSVKVFAISNYLKEHYTKKNISCVRIPVIFDMEKEIEKNISSDKIIYIYAGSPGKKDNLDLILKGFSLLETSELNKIQIQLFGVNDEQAKQLVSECDYNKLRVCLKCFGRVSHAKVLEAYKKANYSILLRNDKMRYAQAGFPTKVVESLMCSTPIITNYTSDLQIYLTDKKNAVIVENYSSSSFSDAVKKSMLISTENQKKMQKNCYQTAIKNFDYNNYVEIIKDFINE